MPNAWTDNDEDSEFEEEYQKKFGHSQDESLPLLRFQRIGKNKQKRMRNIVLEKGMQNGVWKKPRRDSGHLE
jgi:hypothetical protein